MIDSFYDTEHLPQEKLHQLIKKSDYHAIFRFTLMYSFILISAAAVVLTWSEPWYFALSAHIAFAIGFCSSFACEHETAHATAFKSKALNVIAGRLCGFVQLYPSVLFKEFHFTHHRYTHDPHKDPEISFGGKPMPAAVSSLPNYIVWITGMPLYFIKFVMLFVSLIGLPEFIKKATFPFVKNRVRGALFFEALTIVLVHAIIVYLAINYYTGFWGIYTALFLGHSFLAIYLVPEHNGLTHEGTIMEKTRTMYVNPFVKFVMWNMPYHAEHHAYPAVPFHALPELRQALKNDLINKEEYPAFHFKVLSRKVK
jgi:fatty acid desaturase